MKMNLFVVNWQHQIEECGLREPGGKWAVDLIDPEADLVEQIDDEKLSPEQFIAKKFIKFLADNRLTVEKANQLPPKEQRRLRREFLEII